MSERTTNELAQVIWDYHHVHHPLEKADGILVLGSLDVRVASWGTQLFLNEWAPLLIMSGGVGELTKGLWERSEAEEFAAIAVRMGVPEERILVETRSTNTGQNIQFTRALLEEKHIPVKKLIVVQKPYMERRTYATFKKQWPGMEFIVSSPALSLDEYCTEEMPFDKVVTIMVGDLQRVKEYPARGFQIPQDIPDDVWNAYEELVRRGYTGHLIRTKE